MSVNEEPEKDHETKPTESSETVPTEPQQDPQPETDPCMEALIELGAIDSPDDLEAELGSIGGCPDEELAELAASENPDGGDWGELGDLLGELGEQGDDPRTRLFDSPPSSDIDPLTGLFPADAPPPMEAGTSPAPQPSKDTAPRKMSGGSTAKAPLMGSARQPRNSNRGKGTAMPANDTHDSKNIEPNDDGAANAEHALARTFKSWQVQMLITIILLIAGFALVYFYADRTPAITSPTDPTATLTEDRVRELVKEEFGPAIASVGELPQLLEKIQATVQQLERVNAEDKDRLSRSIQGLSQRLADETDAERRETEKLRQEIMGLEQRLARAEQQARTGPSVRPTPPVVDPTPPLPVRPTPPPPPPSRSPRTVNDPVVAITFGDVPAHSDSAPVEFRFIRMTEAGRVSVERPDTKPNARPEWLPVRVVRDASGVLWGVLSLPVRTDGEQLTIKYVSHYPPRSVADWGRISASTSFYTSGPSGDGLTIVVNPRAGTATRGTIR